MELEGRAYKGEIEMTINNVKNRSISMWILSFLVIFSPSSILLAHQITISFDSLFPVTWYQKGLESCLYVWQALSDVFIRNGDGELLSCDILLGRLVLAQFCIQRMTQENVACLPEDSAYLVSVLNKVQGLLAMILITQKTEDFVLCAGDMIASMQKQLLQFTSPR